MPHVDPVCRSFPSRHATLRATGVLSPVPVLIPRAYWPAAVYIRQIQQNLEHLGETESSEVRWMRVTGHHSHFDCFGDVHSRADLLIDHIQRFSELTEFDNR